MCNFVITSFREDVQIVFCGINTDHAIFELTAKAFLEVCGIFCKAKDQDSHTYVLLLSSESFPISIMIISILS